MATTSACASSWLLPPAPVHAVRVAVVTRDGYHVTGRGDPLTAAVDLALLDDFFSFLECRLQTSNLVLLRRMSAEFLCHEDRSLRQFVAIGARLISVVPLEHAPTNERDSNRRGMIAQQLRCKPKPAVPSASCLALFSYLRAQLDTRNLPLLWQFLVEFCAGKETALAAFIARNSEVVSVLPSLLVVSWARPPPDSQLEPVTMEKNRNEPANKTPRQRRQEAASKRRSLPSESSSSSAVTPPRPRPRPRPRSGKSLQTTSPHWVPKKSRKVASARRRASSKINLPGRRVTLPAKTHARLQRVYRALEAEKPWQRVYAHLPLPFDEMEAPMLAAKLRCFWRDHGHAVWERNFWRPVPALEEDGDVAGRYHRRRKASCCFMEIIVQAYDAFGAEFFVRLDARASKHPGWWYRPVVVDLWSLCSLEGEQRCLEYLQTQSHQRFPDCGLPLPLASSNAVCMQYQFDQIVSASMWLITKDARSIAIRKDVLHAARAARE